MGTEAKQYAEARKVLARMIPQYEPTYVWLERGDSSRGESCWTDEQGVQHWKVWDENGTREFERKV